MMYYHFKMICREIREANVSCALIRERTFLVHRGKPNGQKSRKYSPWGRLEQSTKRKAEIRWHQRQGSVLG